MTAKIRLGCTRSSINAIEVAKTIESAGAAAITVHGRTAQDFFTGSADWQRISEIKDHLQRIPLIGNGDLTSADAVVEGFRLYNIDGVMIAGGTRQAVDLPPGGRRTARRAGPARSDSRGGTPPFIAPL